MYVFYSRVIEDVTCTLAPHCSYRRCNSRVDVLENLHIDVNR